MNGKETKFQGTVYHWRDLETHKYSKLIAEGRRLWKQRTEEYLRQHGDRGTCVMGAGIAVYLINKRCRNHKSTVIIDAPGLQGCLAWEHSLDEVLDFLRKGGLDCYYHAGMMD